MRMSLTLILAFAPLAITACKPAAEPAPTPVEKVAAAAPATDAAPAAPTVLSAADLRRVCRAGLAAIHGQDVSMIEVSGVTGQVVSASWRAPVDGGRMRAECRVDDDLITWKPLDLPDATQVRWMNQSGDPVVRYALDGDRVIVTQTQPDGANERSELTVPAEQEAR
jgi:hypothetical protein